MFYEIAYTRKDKTFIEQLNLKALIECLKFIEQNADYKLLGVKPI